MVWNGGLFPEKYSLKATFRQQRNKKQLTALLFVLYICSGPREVFKKNADLQFYLFWPIVL